MALHHKLCHTLGGTFGLPHAETHSIILPHALAYNAPCVPEAMATLRLALDDDDPATALYRLGEAAGLPRSLREIGKHGRASWRESVCKYGSRWVVDESLKKK